jgi:hypothetical protein
MCMAGNLGALTAVRCADMAAQKSPECSTRRVPASFSDHVPDVQIPEERSTGVAIG